MHDLVEIQPELKFIELALSNICNLSPPCITCFSQQVMDEKEKILADNDVVNKVIKYLPKIDKLFLGGLGEPTVHPLFLKIIDNGNGKVSFLTNGLFLNEKIIEIIANNVLGINVSLDAASPKMFAIMRKDEETFQKIIGNVKRIISLRQNKRVPVVNFSFVISKANIGEICDFVILANEVGIDSVSFTTLNTTFTGNYKIIKNNHTWDYQQQVVLPQDKFLENSIINAMELAKQRGISVKTIWGPNYISPHYIDYTNIPVPDFYFPKGICPRPWRGFFIKPDGNVTLCCHTYSNNIGNILNDDLEELLTNSHTLNIIRNNFKNGKLPIFCKDCFWIPDIIRFRGYKYIFEINEPTFVKQDIFLILKGRIKNIGECAWINEGLGVEESFKIGGRIFSCEDNKLTLMELRTYLPNMAPQDVYGFELRINTQNLVRGSYLLKVDVLKENAFWFEDMGAIPLIFKLDV